MKIHSKTKAETPYGMHEFAGETGDHGLLAMPRLMERAAEDSLRMLAWQAAPFKETAGDPRIAAEHKANIARYFTDTWPSLVPGHQEQQLKRGNYFLCDPDGGLHKCTSARQLADFTGCAGASRLPELILHVAGPQLPNFLCQTYLYNPALALFGHVGQRRVEPVPSLQAVFQLERDSQGQIAVDYVACDDHVDRVMLVGSHDCDEHESRLSYPASIVFSGRLRFFPDCTFSVEPVQVRASGLLLVEPATGQSINAFA